MKFKWMIPYAAVFLVLAFAILAIQGISQAQNIQVGLTITKSVNEPVVAPDETVIYTVTLSNTTGATLTVSSLVDTLPTGFDYIGLAPGSKWDQEPSVSLPKVHWQGPITVAASSTLTLCYSVYIPPNVPLQGTPYTNTVTATVGLDTYEDTASVLVGIGDVSLVKSASASVVEPGAAVTYTITFSNSGYVTEPLAVVTDELPADVEFVETTDQSDVDAPPVGVTGTITWTGPFTIPAHGEFVVQFRANTPVTSDSLTLENVAWGRQGDGTVLSDSVKIEIRDTSTKTVFLPGVFYNYVPAAFDVAKTADPEIVYNKAPGGLVTYEVTFTNKGTVPGVIAEVKDTLPAGFVFQNMMSGSDVTAPPSGTWGTITWTGPFTVPGGATLKLIYQVRATTVLGTYENSVTATVSDGLPPEAPAKAAVRVTTPTLFEEKWENPSPYWQPFTNYWRLNDLQWHRDVGIGVGGSAAMNHTYWYGVSDPEDGAHDALYMYQGPGAEEWKNYRFEADVKLNSGEILGFWFRGQYEPSERGGRHVEGYYLVWRPQSDWVRLLYVNNEGNWAYHFSSPIELVRADYVLSRNQWHHVAVEVRDSNIQVFIDGNQVINIDDSTYTKGTVGLKAYKVVDAAWDNLVVTELP